MPSSLPLFDDVDPAPAVAEDLLRRAAAVEGGHHDELRGPDGGLRPAWQTFADQLGAPLDDLTRRQALLARQINEDGITYNVYNAQGEPSRPWSLETLPLLIDADEWRGLERGIAQRASLLDHILRDVYGPQSALKEGDRKSVV